MDTHALSITNLPDPTCRGAELQSSAGKGGYCYCMNKAQDLGWAYAHQIRTSTHSQSFFSSLFFASYLF